LIAYNALEAFLSSFYILSGFWLVLAASIHEFKEKTGDKRKERGDRQRERERDSQWNKRAFFVQVEEVGVVVGKNQKRKSKKDGDDVAAAAAADVVACFYMPLLLFFFYSKWWVRD
jgi:ribosomal protein S19E (S16A)